MPSSTRWDTAQNYEKAWWQARISEYDPAFYRNYAATLRHQVHPYLRIQPDTHILEIGSGAAGILTYLKESRHRYALDPLEAFYSSVDQFTGSRDPQVAYAEGRGENIPFKGEMFDLVIIDNVLDHCASPRKVLSEIQRVLKRSGVVYLRLNLYHRWGKLVRTLAETLRIDKGHPYTFTRKQLDALIAQSELEAVKVEMSSYFTTWKRELMSGQTKDLAKALTFATRNKTLYLLQKP